MLWWTVLALFHVQKNGFVSFSESFLDPFVLRVLVLLILIFDLTPPLFIALSNLLVLYLSNVFVFQILVETVFDLADSPSKQRLHFGYLRPLWSDLVMHHQNESIFFWSPLPPHDWGVYDVVPPLPALAAEASWESARNDHPVLGTELLHLLAKYPIFLLGPLSTRANIFGSRRAHLTFILFQRKPTLEATDLGLVRHELAEAVPWLVTVDLN